MGGTSESFRTTRWSIVQAVRASDPGRAKAALEELCGTYWFPLYAFARRSGLAPEAAEDSTQAFFARLLDRGDLARVEMTGGRFRSFLLVALRNFIANERERERALKRGGDRRPVSIDLERAESRCSLEIPDHETPERAFERAWAQSLLDRVFATLRAEYEARGRGEMFQGLQGDLLGERSPEDRRAAADELGMSEGALDTARYRLRRRFGEVMRAEVAETLEDPSLVDRELATLIEHLGPARESPRIP